MAYHTEPWLFNSAWSELAYSFLLIISIIRDGMKIDIVYSNLLGIAYKMIINDNNIQILEVRYDEHVKV